MSDNLLKESKEHFENSFQDEIASTNLNLGDCCLKFKCLSKKEANIILVKDYE